jgi:hypothetical protein
MNNELKEKGLEYMKEVESKRALPLRKSWFGNTYIKYESSTDKAIKFKPAKETPLAVDIKNNIAFYFIIPFWLIGFFITFNVWKTGVKWFEVCKGILYFGCCLAFSIRFAYIPGKWIWLRLTHHGLWLSGEHILVKWDDIVWAGIETIPDDDNDEVNFVLNYYDERYQCFNEYRINMSKLCVSNAELCFYIEHFRKQTHHPKSHTALS